MQNLSIHNAEDVLKPTAHFQIHSTPRQRELESENHVIPAKLHLLRFLRVQMLDSFTRLARIVRNSRYKPFVPTLSRLPIQAIRCKNVLRRSRLRGDEPADEEERDLHEEQHRDEAEKLPVRCGLDYDAGHFPTPECERRRGRKEFKSLMSHCSRWHAYRAAQLTAIVESGARCYPYAKLVDVFSLRARVQLLKWREESG